MKKKKTNKKNPFNKNNVLYLFSSGKIKEAEELFKISKNKVTLVKKSINDNNYDIFDFLYPHLNIDQKREIFKFSCSKIDGVVFDKIYSDPNINQIYTDVCLILSIKHQNIYFIKKLLIFGTYNKIYKGVYPITQCLINSNFTDDNFEIFKILVDICDLNVNSDHGTPLNVSVMCYDIKPEYFNLLISKNNADINLENSDGTYPLISALEIFDRKNFTCFKRLLELENININCLDNNGENILFHIVKNGKTEILKYFINHAKFSEIDINHKNKKGETAFMCNCFEEIFDILIKIPGINIFEIDNDENNGFIKIVKNLFEDDDYLLEFYEGDYKKGKNELVDKIIDLNIYDLNYQNNFGKTIFNYLPRYYYYLFKFCEAEDIEELREYFDLENSKDIYKKLKYFSEDQIEILSDYLDYDLLMCESISEFKLKRVTFYKDLCKKDNKRYFRTIANRISKLVDKIDDQNKYLVRRNRIKDILNIINSI